MLFKNTGAVEAAARGCNWLTYVCLPFWLTPQQFGTFSFLLAIVLVVSALGTAGQDRAILRYINPKSDHHQKQRITIGFLIAALFSLCVLGAFLIVMNLFDMLSLFHGTIYWVAIWSILQGFYMLAISLARALSNNTAFMVIRAVYSVTKLVTMAVVAATSQNIQYLVITEIVLLGLILVFTYFSFVSDFKMPTDSRVWKGSFWFGLPLVFHILAGATLGHLDKLMIADMLDETALGVYAFLNSIAGGVFFVFAVINIVYEAKVYQLGEGAEAEALMKKMFFIAFGLAVTLLLLTNLALPNVLDYASKSDYYHRDVMLMLSAAYLIYPLYLQSNIRFALKEQTKYIPLMTGLAAAVNIGLNLYLIPEYGILGAAYSTLGAYLTLVTIAQLASRKV